MFNQQQRRVLLVNFKHYVAQITCKIIGHRISKVYPKVVDLSVFNLVQKPGDPLFFLMDKGTYIASNRKVLARCARCGFWEIKIDYDASQKRV